MLPAGCTADSFDTREHHGASIGRQGDALGRSSGGALGLGIGVGWGRSWGVECVATSTWSGWDMLQS